MAINLSGFNGIDFNSLLNTVMQSESQPLYALQAQQQAIQTKDAALSSMAATLGRIQTPATALTASTAFTNVAATSSDTSLATVSLGSGGIAGQYGLTIDFLAKGQVTSSTNGYSNPNDIAASGGTISFTIGAETTADIEITADTTLLELKEKINNQSSGVVASVINDGTNYKLIVSSRETGGTNGFTINNNLTNTPGAAVAFAVGQNATTGNAQDARNAEFTLNGIDIESASNTVSEAVPGVTLSLVQTGSLTVKVTQDFGAIKDNLKTLVAEYNRFRQFYTQQSKGSLSTDTVLRQASSDIKAVLLRANSNGGRYQYLSEVGIELTSAGELKLDETKLNTALNSYSGDLQKLLQGTDTVDGVMNQLQDTLSNLDGTAGLIKVSRKGIDASLKSLRGRMDSQELRLELKRKELIKVYSEADRAMSRLNAASGSLQSLQTRLF